MDTDHLSLLFRDNDRVVARLVEKAESEIAITIISVEEQIQGRFSAIQRGQQLADAEKVARNYRLLRITLEKLQAFRILDFTVAAYEQFQDLRQQKIRIGTQDLRIASIALCLSATVVTRNQRDFERVPNLRLEDWTVKP